MVWAHGLRGPGPGTAAGARRGYSEGNPRKRANEDRRSRGRAHWMVWAHGLRGPGPGTAAGDTTRVFRGRPERAEDRRPLMNERKSSPVSAGPFEVSLTEGVSRAGAGAGPERRRARGLLRRGRGRAAAPRRARPRDRARARRRRQTLLVGRRGELAETPREMARPALRRVHVGARNRRVEVSGHYRAVRCEATRPRHGGGQSGARVRRGDGGQDVFRNAAGLGRRRHLEGLPGRGRRLASELARAAARGNEKLRRGPSRPALSPTPQKRCSSRRVAATPRPRRGHPAAAATPRAPRGDVPRRRVAAADVPLKRLKATPRVDSPRTGRGQALEGRGLSTDSVGSA